MEWLYFVAALFLFLIGKSIYSAVSFKKKTLSKIKRDFGKLKNEEDEESIQLVDSFFIHKCENDNSFFLDRITSNDLKIVDFFCLMNSCKSQAGAEYLYYILNAPCFDEKELSERERLIEYFRVNTTSRVNVLYVLSKIGRSKKKISLYDCIEMLDKIKLSSNISNWFSLFAFFAAIAVIFVAQTTGIILTILIVIYNIVSYYKIKSELQGYLYCTKKLCSLLKASESLCKLQIPELSEYCKEISKETGKLSRLKKGAFAINSEVQGDLSASLMEYVNILLHIDLITFSRSLSCAAANKEALRILYEKIGFLDAMIAVANLRQATNQWCIPDLRVESGKGISFEGLYHPSLSEPVPADLSTEKCILLTGSNASGKSTFLKAVALNAVLAQTIHTCFAESFSNSFCKVYTSMALNDDIYNGESYYITEIKALKRVIDADDSYTVLAFIDEVLRGTNTVERIASSTSALKLLAKKNVICFAATHDIELTKLLEDSYSNYHFEEVLDENGDIFFDYELKEGPSNTKNAIKLLKSMGYEPEITENAERMAEHFVKTGAWEK